MSRLQEEYNNVIKTDLKDKLGLKNIFEVPRLRKIILNMGVGDGKDDSKLIDKALEDLTLKTKSKKAISGFKIREGMPLGVKVTLRNKIMYEFLDRLVNIAIPRIRDFRGLNINSFDGNGNYSMGIKEHVIFPEINFDKVDKVRGMDITICTSAKNNNGALELLKSFNMPFKQNQIN